MISNHLGVDIEKIKASTGFDLIIPKDLKNTESPIVKEIVLLREKVAPLNIRKLDVLSGKEREELLNDIIEEELKRVSKYPKLLI